MMAVVKVVDWAQQWVVWKVLERVDEKAVYLAEQLGCVWAEH